MKKNKFRALSLLLAGVLVISQLGEYGEAKAEKKLALEASESLILDSDENLYEGREFVEDDKTILHLTTAGEIDRVEYLGENSKLSEIEFDYEKEIEDETLSYSKSNKNSSRILLRDNPSSGSAISSGEDVSSGSAISSGTATELTKRERWHEMYVDASSSYAFEQMGTEFSGTIKQRFYMRALSLFEEILYYDGDYENIEVWGENVSSRKGYYTGKLRYSDLGISGSEAVHVIDFFVLDHPIIFFQKSTFYDDNYLYFFMNSDYAEGEIRHGLLDYILEYLVSVQKTIDEDPEKYDSNYDIIKYVHDQVVKKVNYMHSYNDESLVQKAHNIIGFFRDFFGDEPMFVCDGYSRTNQLILSYLDVFCITMIGKACSADEYYDSDAGHAWNVVGLGNGLYYYMDLTWDDNLSSQTTGTDNISYAYYFKGKTQFLTNHTSFRQVDGGSCLQEPEIPDDNFDMNLGEEDVRRNLDNPTYTICDCDELEEVTFSYSSDGTLTFSGNGILYTEKNYLLNSWEKHKYSTKKIVFEEGIVAIGASAFKNFIYLEDIEFSNTIKAIGSYAFYGCSRLKEVELSDSIVTIGSCSFGDCSNLTDFRLGKMTGAKDFRYDVKIYNDFIYSSNNVESLTVDEENEVIKVIDNVLFSKDGTNLILYLKNKKDENYVIPDGVTKLYNESFSRNPYLKEVTLCDGITEYGDSVFIGCIKLKTINFMNPGTDKVNYSKSFLYSTNVENITVSEDNAYFSLVDGVLFADHGKKLIYYPDGREETEYCIPSGCQTVCCFSFDSPNNLTKITMADSVKVLEMEAFFYLYNLDEVVIGKGVNSINDSAFWGSYSILKIVNNSNTNCKLKQFGYHTVDGVAGYYYWVDSESGEYIDKISNGTAELKMKSLAMGVNKEFEKDGITYKIESYSDWVFDGKRTMDNKKDWTFTLDELNNSKDFGVVYAYSDDDFELDIQSVEFEGWNYEVKNGLRSVVLEDGTMKVYGEGKLSRDCFGNKLESYKETVTNIVIGGLITEIDDETFEGFSEVKSVRISSSVKRIGDRAFARMDSLTVLFIPATVTEIGEDITWYSSRLQMVSNLSSADLSLPITATYLNDSVNVTYYKKPGTDGNQACDSISSGNVAIKESLKGLLLLDEEVEINGFKMKLAGYSNSEWIKFSNKAAKKEEVSISSNAFNSIDCLGYLNVYDYGSDYTLDTEIPEVCDTVKVGDFTYMIQSVKLPEYNPNPTNTPEITKEPEVTKEPENTKEPEVTDVPEITSSPDAPATSVSPKSTLTPSKDLETKEPVNPYNTVSPSKPYESSAPGEKDALSTSRPYPTFIVVEFDETNDDDKYSKLTESTGVNNTEAVSSVVSTNSSVKNQGESATPVASAYNAEIDASALYKAGKCIYRIISNDASNLQVECYGLLNRDGKGVTIPKAIEINGKKYAVTQISKSAFKGMEIRKVVIPSTIQKIGANAFKNCIYLKKIVVKTNKLKKSTVGKNAFLNIYKSAKFTVPKSKRKSYFSIFRARGASDYIRF